MRVRPRYGVLMPALLAISCGAGQSDPDAAASEAIEVLSVRTLSEPLWEIGDFEGTTDQTLDFVAGVATLPDDRIAILDQGASQVLVFDEEGALLQRIGRAGDGPGEFRSATDIRLRPGDSIWVLDSWGMNVSQFSPEGEYVDEFPASDLSQNATFPLDVYFHDRFWVDGALTLEERGRVNNILDRSSFPIEKNGFRFVKVAEDRSLWIREQIGSGTQPSRWVVLNPEGRPSYMVELPSSFDPLEIQGDDLLGRWRDELDVNYLRRYQLVDAGRTAELPLWLAEGRQPQPETSALMSDSMRSVMMGNIKHLASLQEINYSRSYSYTTSVDSLYADADIELPNGFAAHVLFASSQGWGMVATMQGYEEICSISYGYGTPPGMYSGKVVCGRERSTPSPASALPTKNKEN